MLDCLGRDGTLRTFRWEIESDGSEGKWYFRVFADPLPASGEFFDLTVSAINDTTVRVVAMFHHYEPEYMAKGIPDALLPAVKATLERHVVSSPTNADDGCWRTPDATKAWQRLRAAGLATYDPSADIYTLT